MQRQQVHRLLMDVTLTVLGELVVERQLVLLHEKLLLVALLALGGSQDLLLGRRQVEHLVVEPAVEAGSEEVGHVAEPWVAGALEDLCQQRLEK